MSVRSGLISLFICLIFEGFSPYFVQAQEISNIQITNERELKLEIGKLIDPKFVIDSTKLVKLIFEFKIDSLGEVHSAHVRWSEYFRCQDYYPYTICNKIETSFNLLFIYERYKWEFEGLKYVYAMFPYFGGE